MDRKDEEFLKRLLETFRIEAQEHLKVISSGLIELEKAEAGESDAIVETVYRECHSLKGAARSVDLSAIVSICQSMENVFSAAKKHKIVISQKLLDMLHHAIGLTRRLVAGEELDSSKKAEARELVRGLESQTEKREKINGKSQREPARKATGQEKHPAVDEVSGPAAVSIEGTIRISTAKLDALLLKAEEMLAIKLAAGQRAAELKDLKKIFDKLRKEANQGARDTEAGDVFSSLEYAISGLVKSADSDQRSFSGMIDALLDDVKNALMLPVSSLLEAFPGLVRNISREVGKQVELTIRGGDIEVDRRVLEEIKDPLIHLVRNCIDHGIELPSEREKRNKPAAGNIGIAVSSKDGKIEIAVEDDGAGIDASKIRASAERSGFISREEADRLSDQEVLLLLFRSGITTSPIITDMSGRGLGLAIVREKAEKLNGTVSIDSHAGIGTTISMLVPMTLVTFRGVLVGIDERAFVIPSANVERVARIDKEDIRTVENRETIAIDGHVISLVRLADVLGINSKNVSAGEGARPPVVVVASAEKRMAFLTDEVYHDREVLVKSLGRQLSRVRHIAGATVLGSGKVVPILNVSDLIKSAVNVVPSRMAPAEVGVGKKKSVLVAEDSITARTLLKTILESAGYEVRTAVDGIDAITALKAGNFDVVVSDVDMPRMNGFDLTSKIRADKKFSDLPVILVTALESREDKERGIDVGANAYIVKSSFDQSNLLEVIGRLI